MGLVTAAAIVGGASIVSGLMQAEAQGNIAEAQGSAAERMRREALAFAAPTAQELENISKQVALYDRMYSQQTAVIDQLTKQMVDTYGPAIMEQGKQFFKQLQGEASGVVKSFDSQRSRQREQLRQQLIERMGPGALTSSAGVNALNDFDQKTSDMRAGIEEQSLNNAVNRLGSLQQTQGAAGSTVFNAYSGMSNLLNNIQTGMGNIQSRQVNAATLSAQPIIGTAGAEYVSQMGTAKAIGEGFSQAGKIYAMGKMFGGGKVTPDTGGFEPQGFDYNIDQNLGYTPQQNPNVSLLGGEPTFGDFTFNP